MYPDTAYITELHILYKSFDPDQISSSVYHKLLLNKIDKNLSLSVDLDLIRLFVLMLFITV